jgi:dTDP-4-dehydrorhamnose reductase
MIPIIITGASGQLGKACLELLSFKDDFSMYSFDRRQLDIADKEKVEGVLSTLPHVKYWINCAAYTKVDDAESHPDEATLYNATAVQYIAQACHAKGVHLFHFSSDYVYHNDLRRPLTEEDPTTPKGVYARTKLDGENMILHSGVSHSIIRTSWVYGPGGHNFVNTMLRLGKTKDQLRIVGDQLGSPTFTHDIVGAIKELIHICEQNGNNTINGIFNFANAGEVTWSDFAKTIFEYSHINCTVEPITTEQYGAPAPRPHYSVMNCDKISSLLTDPIPHWEDALKRHLALLKNNP